jgi:hypothetical protein
MKKIIKTAFIAATLVNASCGSFIDFQNDGPPTACAGLAYDVCREIQPGIFRLDTAGTCSDEPEGVVEMARCEEHISTQKTLEPQISAQLEQAKVCSLSSDCQSVPIFGTSQFGCGLVKNKNYDTSNLNLLLEQWSRTTSEGPSCQKSYVSNAPECQQGQCVAYIKSSGTK